MRVLRWLGAMVVGACLVVGCAKTGSVQEKAPLTQDLAAYRSAAVSVELPPSVKNAEQHKVAMASGLTDRLREKKIFAEVVTENADLAIKIVVTSVDEGSALARGIGPAAGGDAQVAASVDLFDTKQGKSVGAFDVTGNSKKNVQSSVGGVNTAAVEDSTGRALGAAADEIVAYLEQHKAGAKK